METKVCKECGVEKGLDCFYSRERKDGSLYYRPDCIECHLKKRRVPAEKKKKGKFKVEEKDGILVKRCAICLVEKNVDEFYHQFRKGKSTPISNCIDCERARLLPSEAEYRKTHRDQMSASQARYYERNKTEILQDNRDKYNDNIEYERERSAKYRRDNKEIIKTRRAEKAKARRKTDPAFKVKSNVSRMIRRALKKNGASKGGESCQRHLGYSFAMLIQWLEFQFEPWMNWDNYGVYNAKIWDDNNSSTWTWQIDHIMPQSEFDLSSMISPDFLECYALSNQRPLSSKQNFEDGIKRVRHTKVRQKKDNT